MVKKIFYRLILSLPVLISLSVGAAHSATLYVSNFGNNTIEQFDTSGTPMVFATTGLSGPSGLAFDAAGNPVREQCPEQHGAAVLADGRGPGQLRHHRAERTHCPSLRCRRQPVCGQSGWRWHPLRGAAVLADGRGPGQFR